MTTVYLAGLYEWQNGAVTKYYEGGAIRRTGYVADNGVFYVVSDHLRSTSVLVNRDGTVKSRNFYYPYGGNRGGSAFSGVTTKRFTGQYHEQGLPGSEGLSFYNARWYDAQIGVFISADPLVPSPGDPRMFNHYYAYALGNPLRFQDPTGHRACEDDDCLNSGPVVLRYNRSTLSGVVRRYSLSADIINERFVRAVGREATRFKLPARLLY